MSIKNALFKIFNGSAWDEYHFKTNSGQVAHTTEDGEQTTVEEELNRQNRKMPIYEAISMANTSELNYLQWTIPAKYGKIVSVWNDDRTVSTPAVTGFSYLNSDGRIMLIHLDAPYMGPVRLGLLYIPNPE